MATKTEKKKKLKRGAPETSIEDVLTDVSSIHSGTKKKKVEKAGGGWEDAVTKARGKPDGASGDVTTEETPKSGKKFEKGNKKSLNVVEKAAKKIKSLNKPGKATETGKKKPNKDGDGEKKPKIEELSFKERKKQRQAMKTNYGDVLRVKSLWEKLRRADLKPEKKEALAEELYQLIKGRVKELIMAHDTCRVIQCLMKNGGQKHRDALFEELRDHLIELSKMKYAKFFVRKLLKYGNKSQRDFVFKSMHGNVRKLIKHKEASEIIELAYNEYANAQQRSALVEEFYGPSFALFKTEEARTIEQIMASNPEKRDSILANMKEALASLIDKNLCQFSIVHRIFLEYFTFATEKARAEMIEMVRENLIHMLHTREGARITMHCIWSGTPKDRKVIVKSMKTYVLKICKEEYGHLSLLAIFDVVDDTVLVQKVILDEMFKTIHEVASDQFGRKVILYLLRPRDTAHFHPDILKILQQGDVTNVTSKKDTAIRHAELLEACSSPLLKYVALKAKEMVVDSSLVLVLITILKNATDKKGEMVKCHEALANIAAEDFVAGSLENVHIVEHVAGTLALKRLILHDKEMLKNSLTANFSNVLLKTVSDENLQSWTACNRGCFIILNLYELEVPEIVKRLKKVIKAVEPSLKKVKYKGAAVVLSKLKT